MESVIKIASYISLRYKEEFHEDITEMKLHKLLYFVQRESFIRKNEPMFQEQFLAWRYGPVVPQIRTAFATGALTTLPSQSFIEDNKEIFDYVFSNYAPKDAWSLSILSHGELSWQNARKGLLSDQNGEAPLDIEDIKADAERIKIRRFLIDKMEDIQA